MLGTWLWMGLVLFLGALSNNCDVLSCGDLPHKSHLLPTECPCVHESDCSVHSTTECTPAHVHWEQSNRISLCGTASATGTVWNMELRLFSLSYSTILCKQQHQDCSCTCTWVSSGLLSHLSHFTHLCMYKTSWQQLQTSCLAMEAISQTFCSLQEEMGLQSINNQCFHNISASLLFKGLICVIYTVVHLSYWL